MKFLKTLRARLGILQIKKVEDTADKTESDFNKTVEKFRVNFEITLEMK